MPPPKLAPKPKESKPSSGREEPTSSRQEPKMYPLSPQRTDWIYVAYVKFRYNGRPLDRHEISVITAMMLGTEATHSTSLSYLLDRFDRLEDEVTIEHREDASEREQDLLVDIESKFMTYLQQDKDAEDKCTNLEGLTERLPRWKKRTLPYWSGKPARPDQLFLCYALVHFCRDHEGKRLNKTVCNAVFTEKIFHERAINVKLFETLWKEDASVTKDIAEAMNKNRLYIDHFGRKAHKMLKDYASAKNQPEPRLVPPRAIQSDLAATTTGVESLSLTAPASSSSEHAMAGPSQPNVANTEAPTDSYMETIFDFGKFESQPPGASPNASAGSDEEPTGKGKGKQRRERDSSSNSPGKGKSEKPEEKKRRREGKS